MARGREVDSFGTGVKGWTVQTKAVGAGSAWVTVKTGRVANPTVNVPGADGITYDVRVLVADRQQNRKVSSMRRTTFPFDDRNTEITYTGVTVPNTSTGAHLDTTTSLGLGTVATLSFTGAAQLCVMGGPVGVGLSATADLEIDGALAGTAAESDATAVRARVLCVQVGGAGAHTAELTVTSADDFVLDGLYVVR